MKIADLASVVNGQVLTGMINQEVELEYAFASDLMSDVLTISKDKLLLITGLTNIQAIRTAEMADISTILFVRNKTVPPALIELAKENNIAILSCPGSMFRTSGQLFNAGLKPVF